MFTSIDSMPPVNADEETWLLFLPENEFHEMGLLFANYFLRSKGKRVIYLGSNVPLSSVSNTLGNLNIESLLLFMVHSDLPENIQNYIKELMNIVEERKILIAGSGIQSNEFSEYKNLVLLSSVDDLDREVKEVNLA